MKPVERQAKRRDQSNVMLETLEQLQHVTKASKAKIALAEPYPRSL